VTLRKRLAALGASLVLALGLGALAAQPASAAVNTKVCHSSDSSDHSPILVWIIGSNAYYVVEYGTCGPYLSNSNDELRADTCPAIGNGSAGYWIKSDSGYGPFHSGCNGGSNVPNFSGLVYYKLKH